MFTVIEQIQHFSHRIDVQLRRMKKTHFKRYFCAELIVCQRLLSFFPRPDKIMHNGNNFKVAFKSDQEGTDVCEKNADVWSVRENRIDSVPTMECVSELECACVCVCLRVCLCVRVGMCKCVWVCER